MGLSKRLSAVAGLVTEGASVADVGTDHGYVPVYLVEEGISPHALALDIREGPLARARANIEAHGLTDRIEARLSDGLKNVAPGEADAMVAAGMGGGLAIRIMEEGKDTLRGMRFWILQPQSEIALVRRYLNGHGMRILAEDMAAEDGKYYPVMKVAHGEPENYEEWEYRYGKRLLEHTHPVLFSYIKKELQRKEAIFRKLRGQKRTEGTARRLGELESDISCAKKALSCYKAGCEEDAIQLQGRM